LKIANEKEGFKTTEQKMQKIKWPSEQLTNARSHARTQTCTHAQIAATQKNAKTTHEKFR
jgi:hypothetical protein